MEIWIGTVHVRPKPGNEDLGEALGAYVPTLALADSEETYSIRVYELFNKWDFEALEVVNHESLSVRLSREPVDEYLITLADTLGEKNPAAWGKFQVYLNE